MYQPRVFKQKGSRVYRGRYKLSNGPKLYEVALRTDIKHVAEAKLRTLVREKEEELAGLLAPKPLRDAAQTPIAALLVEFIADMVARERCKSHVIHTRCRLERLIKECGWRVLADVTAESFARWRSHQVDLSAKTCNEYLAHSKAFLSWLEGQGRLTRNPLRNVAKAETRGKETFKRRGLGLDDFLKLVQISKRRSLAYSLAGFTGLRRGELKQLLWADVHLDTDFPYIELRASTTKNKKTALIPLVPPLVVLLKEGRAKLGNVSGKVLPRGIPSVKILSADLKACGIEVEDERGFRADFHALRHTFASILAGSGVSEMVRQKLSRHSTWRQTDHYTDPKSLPLFSEMAKLSAQLPPPVAPPTAPLNADFSCSGLSTADQSGAQKESAKILSFIGESPLLDTGVPTWDSDADGARGGTRTPTLLGTGF